MYSDRFFEKSGQILQDEQKFSQLIFEIKICDYYHKLNFILRISHNLKAIITAYVMHLTQNFNYQNLRKIKMTQQIIGVVAPNLTNVARCAPISSHFPLSREVSHPFRSSFHRVKSQFIQITGK